MTLNSQLAQRLEELRKSHAHRIEEMKKRADALYKFSLRGPLEIKDYGWWAFESWHTIDIKMTDLPKLRKFFRCGFEEVGKQPHHNWEETKLIDVTVTPKSGEYAGLLKFKYTKEYKGRGRCKVVTKEQTSKTVHFECPVG